MNSTCLRGVMLNPLVHDLPISMGLQWDILKRTVVNKAGESDLIRKIT